MRKSLVATAMVVSLVGLASPATAGNGGNGKGGGGGNQSPAPPSIALEDYSQPWLGGQVGFETVAPGLAGWEWPMVAVWCYQDLNGDGIHRFPNDAGDLVYAQLDHPDVEFVLGGGSSLWLTLGGAAECDAVLYAYGNRGNTQTIRQLASTSFHAEG